MDKNKMWYIVPVLFLLCLGYVAAAECGAYSTVGGTANATYYGLTSNRYNETVPTTADQAITDYTSFCPAANFTRVVWERIGAGVSTTTVTFKFDLNGTNSTMFNESFALYNNSVLVERLSNYTISGTDNATYYLTYNSDLFQNATNLTAYFNKTFIACAYANADDLIVSPSHTNADTAFASSWLDYANNVSGHYGDTAYIKLDDYQSFGLMINNSNWIITWSYSDRTCTAAVSTEVVAGIHNTQSIAYAGFGLIALMVLVAVAFAVVQVFRGGSVDLMTVAMLAIGGGVVITIAFVIIYYVAKGLGVA